MISKEDRAIICSLAEKFGVKRIILFGSSISRESTAEDIDLAISGIPPENFFRFLGEAMWLLSKPVDVVDLDSNTLFTQMIQRDGTILYDQAA